MVERLRELLEHSYAPLSDYHVAAIIECVDGKLFYGVNVETSSPAAGICAERNALYNLITNGYKKDDIKAIYIMNKTDRECYPCFICRQALCDFCNDDVVITTYNYGGDIVREVKVSDLCPYPFGDEDLEAIK